MGCPRCRSERIRSAPLPLVGSVLTLVTAKRRYQCADCHWRGWHHRLQRRHGASMGVTLQQAEVPQAPALWFAAAVMTFFLVVTGLLVRGCDTQAPVEAGPETRIDSTCTFFTS